MSADGGQLKVHELHTRIARVVKLYSKRLIKANYESETQAGALVCGRVAQA